MTRWQSTRSARNLVRWQPWHRAFNVVPLRCIWNVRRVGEMPLPRGVETPFSAADSSRNSVMTAFGNAKSYTRPGNFLPVLTRCNDCLPRRNALGNAVREGTLSARIANRTGCAMALRGRLGPGLRHYDLVNSSIFRSASNPRRLAPRRAGIISTSQFQIAAKSGYARQTSHGMSGFPSICANGASVSVRTRSGGIIAAKALPFADFNIIGPTLNQHPSLIARSSSFWLPLNQCRIGTPEPGADSRASRTPVAARRECSVRMRPPAAEHARRILASAAS